MAQETQRYRRTLKGSIGAGMKSVMGSSKKYYILEHKNSSKYHKAGESQEIIVDQIEIGRSSKCQVRYDESFATISRRHAAIVKDGENWKLVQLSSTNSTFLNGQIVKSEWYLQNGDEIQLSVKGPKLGFIIPTGKKATVGSIGLTRRMSLFRQQALRPYKAAIISLACLLLICTGAGAYVIYEQGKVISQQGDVISQQGEKILMQDKKIKDNSEALTKANDANAKNEKLIAEQKRQLETQGGLIDSLKKVKPKVIVRNIVKPVPAPDPTIDMSSCHPHVYFITATPIINGKELDELSWVGTGFQLDNGKFVTARHVTTPYYSNYYRIKNGVVRLDPSDSLQVFYELMLNVGFQSGNAKIKFRCTSPGGTFQFTTDAVNEMGKYDEIQTIQESFQIKSENGKVLGEIPAGTQIRTGASGAVDFAYINNGKSQGLKANSNLSTSLKQGTKLYILGYPHGLGQGNPILSNAICAQNGLSRELGGTIIASNDNTEGGNSGGPIFVRNGNSWEVVAIVSGGTGAKGRFVPIAVIP